MERVQQSVVERALDQELGGQDDNLSCIIDYSRRPEELLGYLSLLIIFKMGRRLPSVFC